MHGWLWFFYSISTHMLIIFVKKNYNSTVGLTSGTITDGCQRTNDIHNIHYHNSSITLETLVNINGNN